MPAAWTRALAEA